MLLRVSLFGSIWGFVLILIWKAILFITDNPSCLHNSRLAFNNSLQQTVEVLKCKGQGQNRSFHKLQLSHHVLYKYAFWISRIWWCWADVRKQTWFVSSVALNKTSYSTQLGKPHCPVHPLFWPWFCHLSYNTHTKSETFSSHKL